MQTAYILPREKGEMMKLKELIFGDSAKNHDSTEANYIGSSQAWLPVKKVIGGVVITKDNRYNNHARPYVIKHKITH